MAASATDFYSEVGAPGSATTLSAPGHSIAGTSFTVVSTSNWPTTTGAVFAVDQYTLQTVNGVPNTAVRTPGTYTEWSGVVASSTSITGAVLRYGTDQNYPAGSLTRVYIPVSSSRENRLVQGLLAAGLTQAGGMGAISPTSVTASGTITAAGNVSDNGNTLTQYRVDSTFDYVVSGGVWTADAPGSTRNASMTAIVVWQAGQRLSVGAVTAHSFTASKDTYIDVLNTAGVGSLVYTEVTNNAASPALAANSVRIGIVVTGASNIANAASVNQGQEDRVLPIASSIPYSVTDSLGNLICPRDPNRRILGYRQKITAQTVSTATDTQILELSVPFIPPPGRKVEAVLVVPQLGSTVGFDDHRVSIWDGAVSSGTQLQKYVISPNSSGNTSTPNTVPARTTPLAAGAAASLKTYNAGLSNRNTSGSGSVLIGAATAPAYLEIRLV